MKERPILFSAPMVRALLDGSKTQTRRVMKPQPPEWAKHYYRCISTYSGIAEPRHYWASHETSSAAYDADEEFEIWPGQDKSEDPSDFDVYGLGGFESPFGSEENCIKKASRLWVREAWRTLDHFNALPPRDLDATHAGLIRYEADQDSPLFGFGKLRPSMFMPRWASRIELEIAGVRVERLQDISEADAIAEGIGLNPSAVGVRTSGDNPEPVAVAMYRALWEQINGAGSWAVNPWVWAVEFRRLKP